MNTIFGLSRAARFPLDIAMYILLTLSVVASGALKLWLHTYRWPVVIFICFALIVDILGRRPRHQQLQEGSHVR